MYLKLLRLEVKSFFRNPQFGVNLAMKILAAFGMLYFSLVFLSLPFLLYFYVKEELGADSLVFFCSFFAYYWFADLLIRYFLQPMPTQNIKPFLTLNIKKSTLVKYTIVKTFAHFFNWGYLLFLIPFAVLLILDGEYIWYKVVLWTIAILFTFYISNFLNILLNGKNAVLYSLAAVFVIIGAMEYYGLLAVSKYSEAVFMLFYKAPVTFLIPILITIVFAYFAFQTIRQNFYLDRGLELKKVEARSQNITYLNRFGVMGTFLNNDIRLLLRSKAARSALVASFFFLFYGLLFFNSAYQTDFMKLFAGIFVSGGFMMMFGQRVPSWDSSYYSLMMTQNVPYKKYLIAKWTLIVIGIAVSLLLSTVYLYFGWEVWLTIFAAGLYNLGVNSYVTLLAGAYNKSPVDLNSSAKSFGGKNSFNLKTMLLTIPQLVLPMVVYALITHFFGQMAAVASLGVLGLIGFSLREYIFNFIVKVYRVEKYSTLESFKKES